MPDKEPKMQLPKFVGLVSAPMNFRWTRSLLLGGAVAFPLFVFWWKPEKMIRSTIISSWHQPSCIMSFDEWLFKCANSLCIIGYRAVKCLYRAVQFLLCIVHKRFQKLEAIRRVNSNTMMCMHMWCSSHHSSVMKPTEFCVANKILLVIWRLCWLDPKTASNILIPKSWCRYLLLECCIRYSGMYMYPDVTTIHPYHTR